MEDSSILQHPGLAAAVFFTLAAATMCRSKAEGGRRCDGKGQGHPVQAEAPVIGSAVPWGDSPVDKFLEERADKGPWPDQPPTKGAPRTKGSAGDMGTKANPWPNPPWGMTPNQKADHDYEQPIDVGARDAAQSAKDWVKDKLAGRS